MNAAKDHLLNDRVALEDVIQKSQATKISCQMVGQNARLGQRWVLGCKLVGDIRSEDILLQGNLISCEQEGHSANIHSWEIAQ